MPNLFLEEKMIFKRLEEKELEPSINMYIDYYNDVEGKTLVATFSL